MAVSKGQEGGVTRYGALADKLSVLLSPTAFQGAWFDLAILAFATAVLIGGVLLGRLILAPAMRVPLVVLGAASLAMPSWLTDVWGVDYRLPVVFVFLLIASCEWRDVSARVVIPPPP